MTKKFIGEIEVLGDKDGFEVRMPSSEDIPLKQEWHSWPIWQFNGKAYSPLTQKAEDCLREVLKKLASFGKSKAVKPGQLKQTSMRYAVLTTGIEPFKYV